MLSIKLKETRNKAGLSMDSLADLIEVSKQSIYKYEKNLQSPSPEMLNKISLALNTPIEDFFYKNNRGLSKISFRNGIEHAMIKLSNIEDEIIEELDLIFELERIVDDVPKFKNPLSNFSILKMSDVDKAADNLRSLWGLGEIPIASVVDLLEYKGVCVIEKFSSYQFDGFSAFYKERPLIVLNTSFQEITRRRFTAFHELGHIILEKFVSDKLKHKIEDICNAFAGALLIPSIVLKKFWQGRKSFLMQDFINLKQCFGISIKAIWFRAIFLELITWDTYRKWKDAYEIQTTYGSFVGNETPKSFHFLISKCIAIGRITAEKLIEKVKRLNNNLDKTILMNLKYNMTV